MVVLGAEMRRSKYTVESIESFMTACIILERKGVPNAVVRGSLSRFTLRRRVARASHPTRRSGHPLPVIVSALFHSPALREEIVSSSRKEELTSSLAEVTARGPLGCSSSTLRLARVLEEMAESEEAVSLEEWASDLVDLARKADVDAPVYTRADWYRLAMVVLSSLPSFLTSRHFSGFPSVDRYVFLECEHEIEEIDDGNWIQGASAVGETDLARALLSTKRPAVPVRAIQCPLCHRIGRMTHAKVPISRLEPEKQKLPPSTLWIWLIRHDPDSSGLLRHSVNVPKVIYLDDTGTLRPEEHAGPRYELYGVVLYDSKSERGDPPPEFEGDSGGRFSLAVYLGESDGFYWLRDDKPATPMRGRKAQRLIDQHSHAGLYSLVV